MGPDKETVHSFYLKALHEYMEAVEFSSSMFEDGKKPADGSFEYQAAKTRLGSTGEKLRFIISISKAKYDIDFGNPPIYILGAKAGTA